MKLCATTFLNRALTGVVPVCYVSLHSLKYLERARLVLISLARSLALHRAITASALGTIVVALSHVIFLLEAGFMIHAFLLGE